MKELKRTKVDNFKIEDSITISDLENAEDKEKYLISIEQIFNVEKIELDDRKKELFLNGVKLSIDKKDGLYKVYNNKNFVGLATVKNELLKRDVII